MSEKRVPHWKDLSNQMISITGTAVDRGYRMQELIRQSEQVVVPEKHCAELIQLATDKAAIFEGERGRQMRIGFESIRAHIQAQLDDYIAAKGDTSAGAHSGERETVMAD